MNKNVVTVDFNKKEGKIRPLNGTNNAPYSIQYGADQVLIERYFNEGKIPYCRLHDTCGGFGGTYFVDIPNVFPDFEADAEDPESYDFTLTDEFITAVVKTGCKIVYRLGVTIENSPTVKYRITPPKDFAKWAKICEHIVRHYNEGWANGYYYNIEDWEIWNEPENPPLWSGTKEQYFELYTLTAKHLKKCFPDIKIGGYGSCGFYAVLGLITDDFFKSFVTFFDEFLQYIKREGAPLDFFSWHIYTEDVNAIIGSAKYARQQLDKYGFTETKSSLNEWNYGGEGQGFDNKRKNIGATFALSAFIEMQKSKLIDTAIYYDFNTRTRYNGLVDMYTQLPFKTWHSFVLFSKLRQYDSETFCKADKVSALAVTRPENDAVVISNYDDKPKNLELRLRGGGAYIRSELYVLDEGSDFDLQKSQDGILTNITLSPYSAAMIKFIK